MALALCLGAAVLDPPGCKWVARATQRYIGRGSGKFIDLYFVEFLQSWLGVVVLSTGVAGTNTATLESIHQHP